MDFPRTFRWDTWSQYLSEMGRDGTYGDEITLRAIANIFGIEIIVV